MATRIYHSLGSNNDVAIYPFKYMYSLGIKMIFLIIIIILNKRIILLSKTMILGMCFGNIYENRTSDEKITKKLSEIHNDMQKYTFCIDI